MRLVPRSRAVVACPHGPAMSQRSPSSLVTRLGDQRALVAVRHRAPGSSKPTDAPCHVDMPCRGTARPTPRSANLTARSSGNERRRSFQPLLDRPRTNAALLKGRSAFRRQVPPRRPFVVPCVRKRPAELHSTSPDLSDVALAFARASPTETRRRAATRLRTLPPGPSVVQGFTEGSPPDQTPRRLGSSPTPRGRLHLIDFCRSIQPASTPRGLPNSAPPRHRCRTNLAARRAPTTSTLAGRGGPCDLHPGAPRRFTAGGATFAATARRAGDPVSRSHRAPSVAWPASTEAGNVFGPRSAVRTSLEAGSPGQRRGSPAATTSSCSPFRVAAKANARTSIEAA